MCMCGGYPVLVAQCKALATQTRSCVLSGVASTPAGTSMFIMWIQCEVKHNGDMGYGDIWTVSYWFWEICSLCHNCPTHLAFNCPTHSRHKCPTNLSHKCLIPISPLCLTLHCMCVQNNEHWCASRCWCSPIRCTTATESFKCAQCMHVHVRWLSSSCSSV